MPAISDDGSCCLHGSIVLEDGAVAHDQYVQVQGGRIVSVSAEKPEGVRKPCYALRADELLFPAFLDLHTHTSYNMLPLWHSPVWAWDNRFQWRRNADYKRAIGVTGHAIASTFGQGSKIYAAYSAFSELMAMAGGTTVLQENASLNAAGFPTARHYLIRSTGHAPDLGLGAGEDIASVVDLYEPEPWSAPGTPYQDTTNWSVKPAPKPSYGGASFLADFALSVAGTRTRGTIVHLAEGRSGWLQTRLGPDAYSRKEFEAFQDFLTRSYKTPEDIERVRRAHPVIIHGCGMNTVDHAKGKGSRKTAAVSPTKRTLEFLRTYGIAVIWSPVSNLLLYQDTTNVLPLLDAGLPVVLGTDWTPSGSKTAWEEAKFAADLLEARGWKGDASRTCFQAITSVAADSLGLPLGRVKAGNLADFVILRRPAGASRGDALATFRKAGDDEVRAVFVGGVPLYGEADMLRAFGRKPLPLPDESRAGSRATPSSVARKKHFSLPEGSQITLDELNEALQAADHVVGRNRPRLLAADDDDYQTRMAELREWVQRFDPRTSPTPKPAPPVPTGLAPGELEWFYNPGGDPSQRIPAPVAELLGRIAPCRDSRCEVPKRHPYYHAQVLTEAGDSYGQRVPCMPVVPVLTPLGQLFVMGDYPTAKFTARSANNLPVITDRGDSVNAANAELVKLLDGATKQPHVDPALLEIYTEELTDIVRQAWARPDVSDDAHHHDFGAHQAPDGQAPRHNQFWVPVGDVFAPMQDANYFDGYKVRNVAAGVFLQEYYLEPLGVRVQEQVWLTNLIKCFLFHPSNAASYQALGWTDVKVEASYDALLPVAKVCRQWVDQEVQVCKPRLALTVGKPPCTLLHGLAETSAAVQGRVYNATLGQLLHAGDSRAETRLARNLKLESDGKPISITRGEIWGRYNVLHMLHPQAVMMAQTAVQSGTGAAIATALGDKAKGLTQQQLLQAAGDYVRRHGTEALMRSLPHGQRDNWRANARLLEVHAVSLANLADVLKQLKLVTGGSARAALHKQADELAGSYHLARDADAMLEQLQSLRKETNTRYAQLTH